ncbi:hypothetical protein RIF29_28541 [Crotalaria pallida]|uniref:Uncharacterized protein n=1 Tax=Crotalaria pallida TaxID=3830 RepID=A0AAN9ECT7_CROPI
MASSSSSTSNESESYTEKNLFHMGMKLLQSLSLPQPDNQLLQLLNKLALVLSTVDQAPTEPVKRSLVPSMKALISDKLLRHTNEDVMISVTCCLTEITRISAPEAPYNDEQMKEIFKLIVAAFEKLSDASGYCYEKVLTIIDNFSKVRLCLVMLDLECDDLVIQMFQHFLRKIRSNHLRHVIDCMETIMTLVLDESDEISSDLLRPLLDSVRKENQTVSPISWTLGEKVIANCAVKLKPYLMKAVESSGRTLDDYAQIVTSICQKGSESNGSKKTEVQAAENKLDVPKDADKQPCVVTLEPDPICVRDAQIMDDKIIKKEKAKSGSKRKRNSVPTKNSKISNAKSNSETRNVESVEEPKSESQLNTVPRKRGRKPNSLMNADEGYDSVWISKGKKSGKPVLSRKAPDSSTASRKPKTASEAPISEPRNENIAKPAQSLQDKNALPKPEDTSGGHQTSVSKPKTDENNHVASPSTYYGIPDGSHTKRARPRKRSNTENQDFDSKSVLKLKKGNLKPLLEDTSLESHRLEKEPEARKDAEEKPQKPIRRIKISFRNDEKTAVAPELIVSNIENREEGRSSVQTGIKKRMRVNTPTKHLNESSAIKEPSTESSIPQARRKRSRTTESETRNLGDSLVGSKIKVWWPMDKVFYEGVVKSYDRIKGKHKILYTDGEVEVLNLQKQRWEAIADVFPNEEQGLALHKLAEASDIAQKIKEESELESAKGENINVRPRGRTSPSNSKCKSAKSAVKSMGTSADKFMDDRPKTGGRKNTAGKPKSKRMKTGSDIKKEKPEIDDIEKEKAKVP